MERPKKHVSFSSLVEALRRQVDSIADSRQLSKCKHTLTDVVLSAFACMYFQDRSLLSFQRRMEEEQHRNNLAGLFGVSELPSDTQLRDVLDKIDPKSLLPICTEYVSRLQRGKHLEPFRFMGNRYLVSLDATQYFTSYDVSCPHCLERKSGERTRHCHQAVQAALLHPGMKQVIPLLAEDIRNEDGTKKQDSEVAAGKRLIEGLRRAHPRLAMVIVGDGLYSHTPFVRLVLEKRMDFILTAKPDDHKVMFEYISDGTPEEFEVEREKGERHRYRLMNDVPLTGADDAPSVNFFEFTILKPDKTGKLVSTYRSSWVTNFTITQDNVRDLVPAARARWKIENECFNTLKNQGYHLEHNFGHGQSHLSFNFYCLTLLAFFFHQLFELTDHLYQEARRKWPKYEIWERLRVLVDYFVFQSWETLMRVLLKYELPEPGG